MKYRQYLKYHQINIYIYQCDTIFKMMAYSILKSISLSMLEVQDKFWVKQHFIKVYMIASIVWALSRKKNSLRGFQQSETQPSLLRYRD